MNSIHTSLDVEVCLNADEAIEKGYTYNNDYTPVEVKKVVVVRDGTVRGNPTVDFVMEDASGKKYVFMVTGNLLKALPF